MRDRPRVSIARRVLLRGLLLSLSLGAGPATLVAQEAWRGALAHLPLAANTTQLNQTNCVNRVLDAFRPTADVKALVFLPAAVDELYFFNRVHADLATATPTLLDAIITLTNQTRIRVSFRAPFLLLHTDDDLAQPWSEVKHTPTAERLRQKQLIGWTDFRDSNWDRLQPILRRTVSIKLLPGVDAPDSWHFYRANFAAGNLTGFELLEAVSLATRTSFTVRRGKVVFERIGRQEVLERRGE